MSARLCYILRAAREAAKKSSRAGARRSVKSMQYRFKKRARHSGARTNYAPPVVVKVQEVADAPYKVIGQYTNARIAEEVVNDLKQCGYNDVIVEY